MLERMTERAREVLVNAQAAARRCGHDCIDAPHLLLGILRAADTKGCEALNQAGLRYDDVLASVELMYEQAPEKRELAFGADAKRLFEIVLREAGINKHTSIETAHLAVACTHGDHLPSIERFVAGREQVIRNAALSVLRRREAVPERRHDPPMSAGQPYEALMRANQIRTLRAQLKRDLKGGRA